MKKHYLLTPGPTPIPPQVALKEALPIIHHRTAEFSAIFADVSEGLKYIFQTKNDVYMMASSGTGWPVRRKVSTSWAVMTWRMGI